MSKEKLFSQRLCSIRKFQIYSSLEPQVKFLDSQSIMSGFKINVKPSGRPDLYHVECWPREPQQPYKDGKPQPVPPFPKAEVEVRDDEPAVRWTSFPERFEKIKGELEDSVKEKVKQYRGSS